MSDAEIRALFIETYGRAPRDPDELQGAMLRRAVLAEPGGRAKMNRVVTYAEAQGGDVLVFAKAHWGHYWGPTMIKSPDEVQKQMGMSDDRAAEILAQIITATRGGDTDSTSAAAC